jgi:putative protease
MHETGGGMPMRLAVTLRDWREKSHFSALGAGVFLVHPTGLSCQTDVTFSFGDIRRFIRCCRNEGGSLYVGLNRMLHGDDLPLLDTFFGFLAPEPPDALVAFDLAVVERARAFGLADRVIYRPVTLNTNSRDMDFFASMGIKGILLSEMLNPREWGELARHAHHLEVSVMAHGHLDLFYSRRNLLSQQLENQGMDSSKGLRSSAWRLEESSRSGQRFPIWEDEAGTHVFSARKRESFAALREFGSVLADAFLDRLFLSDAEYSAALAAYADSRSEPDFWREFGSGYLPDRDFQSGENEEVRS